MKKRYGKPMMCFESFSLTQSIAASCGVAHDSEWGKPMMGSKTSCAWSFPTEPPIIIFVDAVQDCSLSVGEKDGEFSGICYNNPSGGLSVFTS